MPNLSGFISFVILATFTPGPNNIMSLTNASKHGFKKSVPFNIGVFFGFAIILGLAAAGSAALYRTLPSVGPYMKIVGCAYILYLAWKTYRSTSHDGEQTAELGLFAGCVLQLINIKGVLYALAVMSTFIIPYYRSVAALAGFAVGLAFTAFVSTSCWALFGAIFQKVLREHEKIINTVMALLLVYCAVSLFL